ncbi:MAG: hypothetical protein KatS3mg129_0387 [Leptospiraceae bacterium]|nr:MAG: hypothetical protein KatS3mg129_0387 [Leptospiraceae bacterium]
MNYRIFIIIFYFILFFLFPVKAYFDVKDIDRLDKVIYYSTNSLLFEDVLKTTQCFDNRIQTSCKEFCYPEGKVLMEKFLYLREKECGFIWQVSPSHIMYKNPPEKNPFYEFGLFLSKEDLKHNVPKKIRLMLYEQQLYHINKDYRFPDQPVYVNEIIIYVQKKEGWQFWNINNFNQTIKESTGFPENIKQRWFKIIIEDIYDNNSYLSISEFYYQDNFFHPL